ncbi:protein kinase [Nocardia sp. NPDC056952]|uniref:serine/threonine-protein kinase n=1 Tax=Nocardia sp. NPDC056952 TaxID=3345979 RepID=UPI003633C60A
MPEKSIGRYDLIEEIGHGGMGSVWRGYDTVLDREVAVKLIRLVRVQSESDAVDFMERFRREARITARIRHHGVPQVYDAVLDAALHQVYLVMELVEGATTLREFLSPDNPLPVTWAASIAAQVATALSYAHVLPVVHRDLKPDNILVTPDGTVKIIDFGIAALLAPGTPKLTNTGAALGTLAYMAPEQAIGDKATPRTDLYALGCVLYEMLSGYAVFAGTSLSVMQHHAYTDPTPLREVRAEVPAALDQLVLDLLAKLPENRPVDAAEVYERLLPILPVAGTAQSLPMTYPSGVPDPTRIFRQPNGPVRMDRVAPTQRFAAAMPQTVPVSDEALEKRLAQGASEYLSLVEAKRYRQAADVVGSLLETAARAFGPDNRRVLYLRLDVALAHLLGGDFRKARSEFDSLGTAFTRIGGATDEDALECRQQAVNCRYELGDLTGALSGVRTLLADVSKIHSDGSRMAMELRLTLGRILALAGERDEAIAVLSDLHEDALLVCGPDDELTREGADALERLMVTEPSPDGPTSG